MTASLTRTADCPDDMQLAAYLEGSLAPEEAQELETHVAECGRCARTIKTIIDEALGACAKQCCSGCPHSRHAANDESAQEAAPAFALAAC